VSAVSTAMGMAPVSRRGRGMPDTERAWRWASFGPALLLMLAMGALPLLNLLVTSFNDVNWTAGSAAKRQRPTKIHTAEPADQGTW